IEQRVDAGVAQQWATWDYHDRHVGQRYLQLAQQCLSRGVRLEIQPRRRQAVPRQRFEQPSRVDIESRAHQRQSGAETQQLRVSVQESTQDQLAQLELLGHEHAKLLNRDTQHAAGGAHDCCQVRALTGKETYLAQKLAWAKLRDDCFSRL